MSLNIINETHNKLIGKKEIKAAVEFTGPTPKKEEIAKMIAAKIGTSENLVNVRIIKTGYGEQKAVVKASVYDTEEIKKKLVKEKKAKTPEADKAKEPAKAK